MDMDEEDRRVMLEAQVEHLTAIVARVEKTLAVWQVGPWSGSTRDVLRDVRAAIDGPSQLDMLRDEAMNRLAKGLDLPPEMLRHSTPDWRDRWWRG